MTELAKPYHLNILLFILLLLLLFFCPEVLHSPRDLETIRRIKAILELPSLVPTEILKSAPKSHCIKLLSANGKALELLLLLLDVLKAKFAYAISASSY